MLILRFSRLFRCSTYHYHKYHSTMANAGKGLVLGYYDSEVEGEALFTTSARKFKDERVKKLPELMQMSGLFGKKCKTAVFYGIDNEFTNIALTNLGKSSAAYSQTEDIEEKRENIRCAVANGVKKLQEQGLTHISVDPCSDAEAAGEGATLGVWSFDELKSADKKKPAVELLCYTDLLDEKSSIEELWRRGCISARGQNLARRLMELPSNHMTPSAFAKVAEELFGKSDKVTLFIRDQSWAEQKQMGAFLSVARGSDEPLKFVEVHYKNGAPNCKPLVLVGKGITFDSGGISLKPSANMDAMRADMGGAACVLSAIHTAVNLKLPINVIGLMPLCENVPSAHSTKPGDVVKSMSGKTIQIDNTDAEGRLILCDALHYANSFEPFGIVDLATLTGAMIIALGSAATGVFTHSTLFWEQMHQAGIRTGDRVWRMPLYKQYTKAMTECHLADINNIDTSANKGAGSCTAAAFLKEFVSIEHWMHMDIAGVMSVATEIPYLCKGMSGRPTRTLVEFMQLISKQM